MYSSVASGGTAIGLIVGGLLTSTLSWRWGMFINVPIGLTIVAFGPRILPSTERHPGRFDVMGAVTSTLGMTLIVYGFVRAAEAGWSNELAIGAFALGVALLVAFVVTEMVAEQPITPLRLFAERVRAGSYLARAFINGGMFAFFFYISQFLEGARNYSPLGVGYAFLPLTLVMFTTAQLIHRIPPHIKPATLIAMGVVTGFIGMAWLQPAVGEHPVLPEHRAADDDARARDRRGLHQADRRFRRRRAASGRGRRGRAGERQPAGRCLAGPGGDGHRLRRSDLACGDPRTGGRQRRSIERR